ncbi:MAG: methylenetetrahydrofolate reductase [Buchnera aphidicola (Kaburagia rhusicola rhusicola)]
MHLLNSRYYEVLNEYLVNFHGKISVSFELFPPKNQTAQKTLWNTINQLKFLHPVFFTVTCGAFLGERNRTYDVANEVKNQTGIETVPHLTCAGLTKDELVIIAKKYWDGGFHHILALRGDIENYKDQSKMYAVDLIKLLKSIADFDISVAAYPEVHPEACNAHFDLVNLKKKIDAGANRAITQFFFSVDHFLRFRDLCVKNGITIDIIPGIFPIINFRQLCNFSKISNVTIPKWIYHMFDGLENNFEISKIIGASITIDIVKVLYKEGIRNFHFYTLNKSEIVISVCHILGLKYKFL